MKQIVFIAKSAFIKNRSIHDNFMFFRNYARWLHRCKKATLLFKLDSKKAFDHVRLGYIFELLQHLGFPPHFHDWVAKLLSISTLGVLLNGIPGNPILHGRGLRQGDPLPSLLFDIAIEQLQRILQVATEQGMLSRLPGKGAHFRTSLYADDAAIFIAPTYDDVSNLARILCNFGSVTGLVTNVEKSIVAPIRCIDSDLDHILHDFSAAVTTFPKKYLGLPLSVKRLKRVHF
jgi:hypothetical protein